MYVSYFGCREHPFHITPDPRFFYANNAYEEAYANLLYGIQERKGFIVLTGEVGTGKTTLLRRLMDELHNSVHFVFFYNTSLNFEEMLDFICQDFDLPLPLQASRLQKIQALNHFLLAQLTEGATGVLLIDEAQNLSDAVLENLRLLSNLETSREKLLQIVLIGQPELDHKLSQPHLRQLKQRIVMWSRLGTLPDREVGPFIYHRLRTAGCDRLDLFSPEAIQRITFYAKGTPRLINVICDNALLITYATSQSRVTVDIIEEVAIDLGLREDKRPLTWQRPQRSLPTPEARHPIHGTSPALPPAPPSRPIAVASQEQIEAVEEIPLHRRSPLPELREEKSVPARQIAQELTPLTTSSLEESRRSRARQIWLVATVTLVVFTVLNIPHFFPFLQKKAQNLGTPSQDSTSLTSELSRHDNPSTLVPTQPQSQESEPLTQTKSPAPEPVLETLPNVGPAPPAPVSSPPLPPPSPSSNSRNSTSLDPTPKPVVTKEVGFAAVQVQRLPFPSQKPTTPTVSQDQEGKIAEKRAKQSRQETDSPQTVLEKPSPIGDKKAGRERALESRSPTADQREEARIALANRGIAQHGSAVLTSAERGDTETLNLLLTAGASPNTTDPKGWNALMLATMHGQAGAVRTLIANGADANDKNEAGGTALMMAAIKGQQEIIQSLLQGGALVNVKNKEGWTPLMYAAWNGHTTAVRLLVDKGAEVNAQNQEGWTPLMCAAWKGNSTAVQTLLSRGASAQAKNKDGETALQLAARREYVEILQLLQPTSTNRE